MIKLLLSNGFVVMTLAGFVFALTDVVIKFISPSVAATQIAFFRFLVGAAIIVPLMAPRRISFKGDRTWILVIRGFVGTLTFLFLLKAIALIPLANAMVLFYTFPVFAAFFSFLLFREPLGWREIALILVGMIGIYVLLGPGSHHFSWGVIFGLLAGCCAGFTIVLIRKLRQTNGPLIIYFYYCLVGGVLCFPFFLREFTMPSQRDLLLMVVLAVLLLVAQLLLSQGFKFCKAAEGSVLLMSEVVFVGIAGILIFRDPLSFGFLMGSLLILVSGVGLNLTQRRTGHGRKENTRDSQV
jgi:drug/metabolite transporter (DMT)-like permease